MRLGVVSDVHANRHALDAVLAFLAAQHVDGYLCAGDLVGYGPAPNECVRRVAALGGPCVAGNHDLIALGRLTDERCAPLARSSLRWTREALEDDARALLAELPAGTAAHGVAVRHGSVRDPCEYVVTEAQAQACLRDLEDAASGTGILVLGHTHRPMAVSSERGTLLRAREGQVRLLPGERVVLNPGAVGQSRSRDPRARVIVLDLGARTASFHAVHYDVDGCRAALREHGLPAGSCHVPRSRWAEVAGAVRRRAIRVRARAGRAGA